MTELSWVTQSQVSELGLIKAATVTLTDDQIKALPTTPVVIIPATETLNFEGFPSSLSKLIAAYLVVDSSSGAYTDITDGYFQLIYGSDGNGSLVGKTLKCQNTTLDYATLSSDPLKPLMSFFILESPPLETGGFLDNAVVLNMINTGVLTGGDAANTLKVIVYYTIVDV